LPHTLCNWKRVLNYKEIHANIWTYYRIRKYKLREHGHNSVYYLAITSACLLSIAGVWSWLAVTS
jgi:hypothetical protein